jgi:hypothetical protein
MVFRLARTNFLRGQMNGQECAEQSDHGYRDPACLLHKIILRLSDDSAIACFGGPRSERPMPWEGALS